MSPLAITEIRQLCTPQTPFLGIVISHPHFYNSSATLFGAIKEGLAPDCIKSDAHVFVSGRDEEWWLRKDDEGIRHVSFVREDIMQVAPGLTFVRCGGEYLRSYVSTS
jgi:hypothetical protein